MSIHRREPLFFVPGEEIPLPRAKVRKVLPQDEATGRLRMPPGAEVFGCFEGKRCVSWAAAAPEKDGVRMITVETQPEFRGRGYATAALCALTHALWEEALCYACMPQNLASVHVAKAAGYRLR